MGITRINNNLTGSLINNLNNLISANLNQSVEELSSGLRINRAGNDAAGLRIASRLQTQILGLNESINTTQSGINLANTADQALSTVTDRLQRIRELTLQAGNTATNDSRAQQAIQAEISQNVDEINRIAGTTQFSRNFLLNGDFNTTAGMRTGTDDLGVNIDSSNLTSRENFLNIALEEAGSAQIVAGDPKGSTQTLNSGIANTRDVAVTTGTLNNGGGFATGTDTLAGLTFNGATLQTGGSVTVQGVLADGTTGFSATVQISAASTVNDLTGAIQSSINQAEQSAGTNTTGGTGAGETNVAFNATTGRIEFRNGAAQGVSEFNVDFTVRNAADDVQNTSGVTRASTIGGVASGGQTGNSVTAFTGSTFATGDITLEVSNVVAAQRRTVESTSALNESGGGAASGTTALVGSVFNGATLAQGDTIRIQGTNADGSSFTNTITISTVDGSAGNGAAVTFQDLIDELNVRDQTAAAGGSSGASGFSSATAAIASDGRFQVTDDIAGESQTRFSIVVNDNSAGGGTFGSFSEGSQVVAAGNAEEATLRINGGPAQVVQAGGTATLTGPTSQGNPQITLTLGSNLTAGTDTIRNTQAVFSGSLNGGSEVRFTAGQQDVRFSSGLRSGETATLDFDAIVPVTGEGAANSQTVILSSSGNQANFQVGANQGQVLGITFGDVRADSLGLGNGQSLEDIDITQPGGVDQALSIIDEALSQVDDVRSRIGAFSNRLESSANSLSVISENLLASRSRITDTDFASSISSLLQNRLQLNANQAVQSQIQNLQNVLFLDLMR